MSITRLCKEFGVLPWEGGLLQQPKSVVRRMEACLNGSSRFEDEKMKDNLAD